MNGWPNVKAMPVELRPMTIEEGVASIRKQREWWERYKFRMRLIRNRQATGREFSKSRIKRNLKKTKR